MSEEPQDPIEAEYQRFKPFLSPNPNDISDADEEWKAFRRKLYHPSAQINREDV